MMLRACSAIAIVTVALLASSRNASAGQGGTSLHLPPTTTPSSEGLQQIDNNQFQAGAIGQLIEPIPPPTIPPARSDPGPSTASAPQPPPGCPPGFAYLGIPSKTTIYPTFTRNSTGGYDGHDAYFGYDAPDVVPASGASQGYAPGSYPVTADNIAGHVIGVSLFIGGPGAITGPSRPIPGVPSGPAGSCAGGAITYGFGFPFVAGDAPPPSPPNSVLSTPPFPLGVALAADLMGHWRIGTISTLPGPDATTRTFVHIPTCAWLDSNVPQAPTALHAIKTATYGGYTFFLMYQVDVTPGPVTWNWGDGAITTTDSAPNSAPPTLPSYDASAQTWTNSCTVWHAYATVAQGRTVTATQTFTTSVTVAWSDGVGAHSAPVACAATGGPCVATVGPKQGWSSGPHPVDQIEPVPFNPSAG